METMIDYTVSKGGAI